MLYVCHVDYGCEQNSDPYRNVILFSFNNNIHDCNYVIATPAAFHLASCIGIGLERSKPPKHDSCRSGPARQGEGNKGKFRK